MRTWTEGDPKSALMTRKRQAILAAALAAFLEEGWAGSSVNRIATAAGVSIATLYRHFDDKHDLFVAVIQDACARAAGVDDPAWLDLPLTEALTAAGIEHLTFVLAPEQLGLRRAVVRDATRFPQLGARYHDQITSERTAVFLRHLERWPPEQRARVRDPHRLAQTWFALLYGDVLDSALLGTEPSRDDVRKTSETAAATLVALVDADAL